MRSMSITEYICLILIVFLSLTQLAGCAKKIQPPPVRTPDQTARPAAPVQPPASSPAQSSQTASSGSLQNSHPTQNKYTVLGQTYTPLSTYEGYEEEGIASWYGPKFHGRKTSNGEIFNMYEMTAAHRVLPMNTKVRVTNLDNGKVIDLRINDRGPFARNRIIDLSFAAARKIDMIGPGTARVRVEATGSVPRDQMKGNFYVQVGSFSSRDNAEAFRRNLRSSGYSESRIQKISRENSNFWRVQAGKFSNLLAAEQARDKLQKEYPGAFILAD